MATEHDMTRPRLEALLRFYAESGLDFPLTPQAPDCFAETARPSPATTEPQPEPSPAAPGAAVPEAVPPDADAVAMADAAARAAIDLDALKAAVEAFQGCNLRRSARQAVFEGGAREASVMLVGPAPNRDDDKNGTAMSGIDGILLDAMFKAIGLDRHTDTYCGFCVPWAVPGGDAPTARHLAICAPFIERQIELARPAIVVALGNVAAGHLIGDARPITKLRGIWTERDFGAHRAAVTALYGPAFVRDQPRFKRQAWLDLLALKQRLRAITPEA